jgi:hypothetical protein
MKTRKRPLWRWWLFKLALWANWRKTKARALRSVRIEGETPEGWTVLATYGSTACVGVPRKCKP